MKHSYWLLLFCVQLIPISATAAETRPNIVLIMADDLGYECIGANGGTSYSTPVLDQLAKDGVRFEHCYSQPICTPSRVKLMTGIYNVRNYAEFGMLERSQVTFGNILSDSGYATCIVGKWQLGKNAGLPKKFGFDEHALWQLLRRPSRYPNPGLEVNGKQVDYKDGYGPDAAVDYACDFIDRNRDRPFLLYYPMILTHCPFEPTPDSKDWDASSQGSKTYKGDPKYFGDMVSYMDKSVGRLLEQLEKAGVRDNTLVLFTGDNGTDQPVVSMMGDRRVVGGKGSTTDAGTRVPLIAHWPGRTAQGQVCRDLVDFSDFLPTLCEAAQVEVPAAPDIDGKSFLPQLLGERGTPREWIYCWYARNGGAKGKEFTRNQQYKLYRSGKFFDIAHDELEQHPVGESSLSPKMRAVRDKLQAALDRYQDARPERFAKWKENKKSDKQNNKQNNNKQNSRQQDSEKADPPTKSKDELPDALLGKTWRVGKQIWIFQGNGELMIVTPNGVLGGPLAAGNTRLFCQVENRNDHPRQVRFHVIPKMTSRDFPRPELPRTVDVTFIDEARVTGTQEKIEFETTQQPETYIAYVEQTVQIADGNNIRTVTRKVPEQRVRIKRETTARIVTHPFQATCVCVPPDIPGGLSFRLASGAPGQAVSVSGLSREAGPGVGDAVSAQVRMLQGHGQVELTARGTFQFTPAPEFVGREYVMYRDRGQFQIIEIRSGDPDALLDDRFSLVPINGSVDTQVAWASPLTADVNGIEIVKGPLHGRCEAIKTAEVANGWVSGIRYTPDQDFTGADVLEYRLTTSETHPAVQLHLNVLAPEKILELRRSAGLEDEAQDAESPPTP